MASDGAEAVASLIVGIHYEEKQRDFSQAFEYYEKAGWLECSFGYVRLSNMFRKGTLVYSLKMAEDYMLKALESEDPDCTPDLFETQENVNAHVFDAHEQNSLKTTKLQEAHIIYKFFKHRLALTTSPSEKPLIPKDTPFDDQRLSKDKSLKFYNLCRCVEFSSFPKTKCMMVQNKDRTVQRLFIYNLERFPARKLHLLEEHGTCFVLKYFFKRKRMMDDGIPAYCVYDPYNLEILPAPDTTKICLPKDKVFEALAQLFVNGEKDKYEEFYSIQIDSSESKNKVNLNIAKSFYELDELQAAYAFVCKCLQEDKTNVKVTELAELCLAQLRNTRTKAIPNPQIAEVPRQPNPDKKVTINIWNRKITRKRKPQKRIHSKPLAEIVRENDLEELKLFLLRHEKIVKNIMSTKEDYLSNMLSIVEGLLTWKYSDNMQKQQSRMSVFAYGLMAIFLRVTEFRCQDLLKILDRTKLPLEEDRRPLRILIERLVYFESQVQSTTIRLLEDVSLQTIVKVMTLYNQVCYTKNWSVHLCVVDALLHFGNYDRSYQISTGIIEKMENKVGADANQFALNAAFCQHRLQMYRQSISFCQRLYKDQRFAAKAYYIASLSYRSLGDINQAEKLASEAVKRSNSWEFVLNLCRIQIKQQKFSEAAKLLEVTEKRLMDFKQDQIEKKACSKACMLLNIALLKQKKEVYRLIWECCKAIGNDERTIAPVIKTLWSLFIKDSQSSIPILQNLPKTAKEYYLEKEIIERWKTSKPPPPPCPYRTIDKIYEFLISSDKKHFSKMDRDETIFEYQRIKESLTGLRSHIKELDEFEQEVQFQRRYLGYMSSFSVDGQLYIILLRDELQLTTVQKIQFLLAVSRGLSIDYFGCSRMEKVLDIRLKVVLEDRTIVFGKEWIEENRHIIAFESKLVPPPPEDEKPKEGECPPRQQETSSEKVEEMKVDSE